MGFLDRFLARWLACKKEHYVSTSTAETRSDNTTSALAWLALSLTPGLGPTRARHLVERFGTAESVLRASLTELEAAGLLSVSAQSLGTGKSLELAHEEMARARAGGVTVVSLDDPSYPLHLKEIYDPPLALYVRGSVEVLSHPGIAVVGTRHPTPYGSGMAERLSCDLAARGLVIISGMARGVDSCAHRGAVAAKAKTIAVFGTGIDVIYPKENTRLAEQILAFGGALISEFPLGTFPAPRIFPFAIASSAACQWACSWWKLPSIVARALLRAAHWSRPATCLLCPAT
jgi:DNA processing protein